MRSTPVFASFVALLLIVVAPPRTMAGDADEWTLAPPEPESIYRLDLPSLATTVSLASEEALPPEAVLGAWDGEPPEAAGGWRLVLEDGRVVVVSAARCLSQAQAAMPGLGAVAGNVLEFTRRQGRLVVLVEGEITHQEATAIQTQIWGGGRSRPDFVGVNLPGASAFYLTGDEFSPTADLWETLWAYLGNLPPREGLRLLANTPTCRAFLVAPSSIMLTASAADGSRWTVAGDIPYAVASLGYVMAIGSPNPPDDVLHVLSDLRAEGYWNPVPGGR